MLSRLLRQPVSSLSSPRPEPTPTYAIAAIPAGQDERTGESRDVGRECVKNSGATGVLFDLHFRALWCAGVQKGKSLND